MAAPHGTAAVGASGDDKKKAFEMAKQVSCVCVLYASVAGSKRLPGSAGDGIPRGVVWEVRER